MRTESRTTLLVLVAVLLAGGGWLLWSSLGSGATPVLDIRLDEPEEADPFSDPFDPLTGSGIAAERLDAGSGDPGDQVDEPATESRGIERSLSGRVLDAAGNPIAEARVVAMAGMRRGQGEARSDDRGRFLLALEASTSATRWDLMVTSDRFAGATFEGALPQGGDVHDVGDLVLARGGTLLGRVVTADNGLGIADAEIGLRPSQRSALFSLYRNAILPKASTDPSGAFELRNVPSGAYWVEARADGFQRAIQRPNVGVRDDETARVPTIELSPGAILSGIVTGPDGAPVTRASLRITSSGETRMRASARTDSEGRFRAPHLAPGLVDVTIHASGFLDTERTAVDPRAGELRVELEEGLRLTVRVIDGVTGDPVTEFAAKPYHVRRLGSDTSADRLRTLELRIEEMRRRGVDPTRIEEMTRVLRGSAGLHGGPDGAHGQPRNPGSPEAHPDGEATFEGLDEGVWVVDVGGPGYQTVRTQEVELRAGGAPGSVTARLPAGLELSGRVIDRGRNPVAEARIELRREFDTGARNRLVNISTTRLAHETRTDAEGRFRFDSAAPGKYVVRVSHPEHSRTDSDEIQLRSNVSGVEIIVDDPAALFGQVANIPSEQRGAVQVIAFARIGRARVATVDSDGSYRIEALEPGRYVVRAFVGDRRTYMLQALAGLRGFGSVNDEQDWDVELVAGEEVRFDPPLDIPEVGRVEGEVVVNGEPAINYRVQAMPIRDDANGAPTRFRGGAIFSATTDQLGRFVLEDVTAGEHDLRVTAGVRSRQEAHRERIVVPGGTTLRTVIAIETGKVAGSVSAPDGTDPGELDGVVHILPGATEAPTNIRAYSREGRVHSGRVLDGKFVVEPVSSGPALVVLEIRGRTATTSTTVVEARSTTELALTAGSVH